MFFFFVVFVVVSVVPVRTDFMNILSGHLIFLLRTHFNNSKFRPVIAHMTYVVFDGYLKKRFQRKCDIPAGRSTVFVGQTETTGFKRSGVHACDRAQQISIFIVSFYESIKFRGVSENHGIMLKCHKFHRGSRWS